MTFFLQILIYGLAVGAIYGVIALGFVVLFKGTGVFNVAQGELLMVGAFVCYTLSVQAGLPFFLAALINVRTKPLPRRYACQAWTYSQLLNRFKSII